MPFDTELTRRLGITGMHILFPDNFASDADKVGLTHCLSFANQKCLWCKVACK